MLDSNTNKYVNVSINNDVSIFSILDSGGGFMIHDVYMDANGVYTILNNRDRGLYKFQFSMVNGVANYKLLDSYRFPRLDGW